MASKKEPKTDGALSEALMWVKNATPEYNRCISIRSSGDGEFLMKRFENSMVVMERVFGGVRELNREVALAATTSPEAFT